MTQEQIKWALIAQRLERQGNTYLAEIIRKIAFGAACGLMVLVMNACGVGGGSKDCSTWSIVGQYEDATFTPDCKLDIPGVGVWTVDAPETVLNSFESYNAVYGTWDDGTNEICVLSIYKGVLEADCDRGIGTFKKVQ